MPHTISGKTRSKRPDSRPNAKRRKKEKAKKVEEADVSDLRATRIPKSEQRERTPGGILKQKQLAPEAKRVKFLTKLLKQIEALRERKEQGETLEEAQLHKIHRYDEVVAEIEALLDVDLGSSDEEKESDQFER